MRLGAAAGRPPWAGERRPKRTPEWARVPGRANAPPGAVVQVSFDGPPDGSEDHHPGSQPSCAQALDVFPRRTMRRLAACRCRQSARQRFGAGPLPWSAVPGTARDSSPALRGASRHDVSGFGMPGRCPAMPPAKTSSSQAAAAPPTFRAPGRPGGERRGSTDPVRRRAARCARRGLFWSCGNPVPATAPRSHQLRATIRASSLDHKGFLISSPCRRRASRRIAPRHYRNPDARSNAPRRRCDVLRPSAGSDGALPAPPAPRRRRAADHRPVPAGHRDLGPVRIPGAQHTLPRG